MRHVDTNQEAEMMTMSERYAELRGVQGVEPGEVDESAVEAFVAEGMTAAEARVIADRLRAMIRRGERARGPQGYVTPATMLATMDRCTEIAEGGAR
jgi:hypothetical protein